MNFPPANWSLKNIEQLYQLNHRVDRSTMACEFQIWIAIEGIVTKMATYDPRFALVTQPRNALGFACTCPECEQAVTDTKIWKRSFSKLLPMARLSLQNTGHYVKEVMKLRHGLKGYHAIFSDFRNILIQSQKFSIERSLCRHLYTVLNPNYKFWKVI